MIKAPGSIGTCVVDTRHGLTPPVSITSPQIAQVRRYKYVPIDDLVVKSSTLQHLSKINKATE